MNRHVPNADATTPGGAPVFDNSYARLPERFFARLTPTPVAAPRLLAWNRALAESLGLDLAALGGEAAAAEIFAGNRPLPGGDPLAMAYAGHQFGHFVPQLGDGRALLLGEVVDAEGRRRDIQLKGSGPTPFSRMGDGRAAIGPVLREYLVSEAMAALGVPTTRSLAAVGTGEAVMRERPLPGAVLTRVSAAHLRVGTFQFFAARRDVEALRTLVDYAIERLYPALGAHAPEDRPLALLEAVMERQAALIPQWMAVGFIHGVMNTDNMSIAGETIDYGPCAFMDAYDPETVFSSIDHMGRYAYRNQPAIAHWNLAMLAQALLPLLGVTGEEGDKEGDKAAIAKAQAVIDRYPALYGAAYLARFRAKLGLSAPESDGTQNEVEDEADAGLITGLLALMTEAKADMTNTFRALIAAAEPAGEARFRARFPDQDAVDGWLTRWRARLAADLAAPEERIARMRRANPAVIPRNHLVEQALSAAERADLGPFERLHAALAEPFEDRAEDDPFTRPPEPEERVLATFCGT